METRTDEMTSNIQERRSGKDRRQRRTNPFSLKWALKGKRRSGRRKTDDTRFFDKYSDRLFFALVIILVLCAFDGVATIYHIVHGTAIELNPIMDYAIQLGSRKYIVFKLALTFACLLMLVFYRHARGVKKAVLFIIFLYILLTIYHLFIFGATLDKSPAAHVFPQCPFVVKLFQ
ncbi:MAG: hypothetical protein JSV84_01015 [Gemmatimonadota bacterium]|nr:MAG: hypothetical protein JSV84_01015 [Gemmatimonadota bacterium]